MFLSPEELSKAVEFVFSTKALNMFLSPKEVSPALEFVFPTKAFNVPLTWRSQFGSRVCLPY